MKTFKEIAEGKIVPTHSANGKPNPGHPAYSTHKASYDAEKALYNAEKAAKAPKILKISYEDQLNKIFYDLTGIIGQIYPDGEPADYFPKYYRANGINYEIARKAFKKNGYKDEYDYIDKMKDNFGYDESVKSKTFKELVGLDEGDWTHVLDADIKADPKEYATPKNLIPRGTVLKKHHNDHYEIKAGLHKGKIFKLSKNAVVEESTETKLEKDMLEESKMGELAIEIGYHVDRHIAKYKKLGGGEQLGSRLHAAGENLAKKHGVKADWMHKQIAHYAEQKMNEGVSPAKEKVSFKEYMNEVEIKKESVFNWKANKSEVDWTDKAPTTTTSKAGGTVHAARDHEKERNAEVGGDAPKKNVGRPTGSYQGNYKARDPASKAASAQKAMASKKDGLAARGEYKQAMHDAIKKRQLELAGIKT